MTSLKTRFLAPALLAGAAALTGCSPNEKDDLHGMTHAINNLCVDNPTGHDKISCVNVAVEQAVFLSQYLGAKNEFKDACDFSKLPQEEGSIEAIVQIEASNVRGCLRAIDQNASPAVRMVTAEINKGLSRGLR
jgi:hypothetical protein